MGITNMKTVEDANREIERMISRTMNVILSCETAEQMFSAFNYYVRVPFYLQKWIYKNNIEINKTNFHVALDFLEEFYIKHRDEMGKKDVRFMNLIKWADKQDE